VPVAGSRWKAREILYTGFSAPSLYDLPHRGMPPAGEGGDANNRLEHTVRDDVLQIFKGQQPAAEPGR
jgi:hypothetical protein